MDKVIHERPLELKYCPGWDINLPRYVFIPYKATCSKTIIDKFSFGMERQAEPMDKVDVINTDVESDIEPEDQEESVIGDGSRTEDHHYHGTQVISAPNTPTLPEKGWEEWEECDVPGAGGSTGMAGRKSRRGRLEDICMPGEESIPSSGIQSRIMDWESRMEVEERSVEAEQMEDGDRRGGRRKSQLFLDLCSKFEEKEKKQEAEVADESGRVAIQSKDPPNFGDMSKTVQATRGSTFSTFSTLKDNWDGYVPRKVVWKQQQIKYSNRGFSLVVSVANKRRGGGQEKGSAGKRLKVK